VKHELFEIPLEAGDGVGPVAADLLYEGVDEGTAPGGVLASNEHPVLVPEFGGADRVGSPVGRYGPSIEFDLAVEEAGFEVGQLVGGAGLSQAEAVARGDAFELTDPADEFGEIHKWFSGFKAADALLFARGACSKRKPFATR